MPRAGRTEVLCVIDKSGSMEPKTSDVIGGFNAFLKEQQKDPEDTYLTLCLFNHNISMPLNGVPIGNVNPFNEKTYVTGGNTALLDAIGLTVNECGQRFAYMPEDKQPEKVLLVIMTDGEENSSCQYSKAQIGEMLQHQQNKYNWTIMYIGQGIDAFSEAQALRLDSTHDSTYVFSSANTSRGTRKAYATISQAVSMTKEKGILDKNLLDDLMSQD